MTKRVLIIGGTSVIAQQCMRLWSSQSDIAEIVIVGRDQQKLEAVKADLATRFPRVKYDIHQLTEFTNDSKIISLISKLSAKPIDMALVAQGVLLEQRKTQEDLSLFKQMIDVNVASVVLFTEAIISIMCHQGHGSLGVISSVAGDKARKKNYHYGASKAMVSYISEGVQHRLANSGVRLCLIKPGPTLTPMTNDIGYANMASASDVAGDIVRGMAKGKRIIYTPWKWRYIMLAIVHLPWFIFKRLDI